MTHEVTRRDLYKAAGATAVVAGAGAVAVDRLLDDDDSSVRTGASISAIDTVNPRDLRSGDVTKIVQERLDTLPEETGGTLVLPTPPGGERYEVQGTIRVGARQTLLLPAGTELWRERSGDTSPIVALEGNFAAVVGQGAITSEVDTPHGVVLLGPNRITSTTENASVRVGDRLLSVPSASFSQADVGSSVSIWPETRGERKFTTTIESVVGPDSVRLADPAPEDLVGRRAYWGDQLASGWASASGVRIRGNGSPASRGVYLNSSPQGSVGLTFSNEIRSCVIDSVGVGVHFGPQANANSVVAAQFQRISDAVLFFDDAAENCVLGGFVHQSKDLDTVVRGHRALLNTVLGLTAEPGAAATPYVLDPESRQNTIQIMHNASAAGVDEGSRNTLWVRDELAAQRVVASDGLILGAIAGGVSDASFARKPAAGLLAYDADRGEVALRAGDGWKTLGSTGGDVVTKATVSFRSVPPGGTVEGRVSVPQAQPGDVVSASPAAAPRGVTWSAYVATAGEVRIRLANPGGRRTPATSGGWAVRVSPAT